MIKELQIRPFARPLAVWITGTLLQVYFPHPMYAVLFLLFPLIAIACSFFVSKGQEKDCHYDTRWVWGAVFVSLLLFFSIQKTAYSQSGLAIAHPVSWVEQLAKTEQQRLMESFDRLRLSDAEKSVLATITIGYRKAMNRDVREKFSITGVAHILSVSGFHVAIVCGFLSLFFSVLPRSEPFKWIKYLLTIVLLWVFTLIAGLAASAVRAAIMLTLYLTGRLLRRTTDSYNILAASAFCMLVYEPLYLFDIGFQLSYTAVFFILYLQPRLKQLIEVRNPLLATPWSWITVTIAAQAGTTLLCLYYFGQFSVVFLFTNLPLTLLATLLIPAGLIWMLLPAGCPGYDWLQFVVEWLTRSMLWIVDAFSRVSFSAFTFRFSFFSMVAGYGILFLSLLYGQTRRPRYLLAALSLLLIILVVMLIEKLKQCGI